MGSTKWDWAVQQSYHESNEIWARFNETAHCNKAIIKHTKCDIDSMRPRSTINIIWIKINVGSTQWDCIVQYSYHESNEIFNRLNETAQYKKAIINHSKYWIGAIRPRSTKSLSWIKRNMGSNQWDREVQ